jgi:D-beta-D-heptose 7-phosphate kinase/D-beta-D-heptose 1-phosphate adenosyltransferase
VTPTLREPALAAEMSITNEEELQTAAELLIEQTAGASLAVTRESKGISLFRKLDGAIVHTHVPTIPVAVYDVTGAGDAVAASLAIALASGIDLVDACALANLAGRAVVRQFGVGTISIGHLIAEASEAVGQAAKLVDLAHAKQRVNEVRRKGGTIVFTNGCFDVLHFGHAHLLQFARARGDFLVLGLNTDESVRRQKGPQRPFVSEEQRAYMLSLYPFVDAIVFFNDDTPLALIEALRPDVLVKGGDYTPDTVVGRDVVESYGGEVAICPRIDGLSTTELVKKIRERSEVL